MAMKLDSILFPNAEICYNILIASLILVLQFLSVNNYCGRHLPVTRCHPSLLDVALYVRNLLCCMASSL